MQSPRRKTTRHAPEYAKFTAHLRRVREAANHTQEEVATSLKISRSQYTNIESGRSMVNFDLLCGLAKFYRVHVWQFIKDIV